MTLSRVSAALLALLLLAPLLACRDEQAQIARHRERAEAYVEQEQWKEAALEYRSILQIDPNDADAHYGLARAFLGQGDGRKAYWELSETVRLDPSNQTAKLELANFLLFGDREARERAAELGAQVAEAEPTDDDFKGHVVRARALQSLGRSEEADEAYARAMEAAPDRVEPVLLRANFLHSEGRIDAAEPFFRRLPEIEQSFTTWAALGGFLAAREGRDAEAEAAYRKALSQAKEKERTTAVTVLANFLYSRGRVGEAEQVIREALEETPDELDLIYALARLHHAQGDREKADAMIQEATRAQPDDPKPFLLLSAYRGRNGDVEGALAAAEQALEADPESAEARLRKAEVLIDLGFREKDPGRTAAGRAVVESVLAREPDHASALFVKAKLDIAEERPEEAVAALRRVIEVRPSWPQAHFLLASVHLMRGERTAARAEATRALELDANFLEARKLLTRVHAALGDHDNAITVGRQVLRIDDDPAIRIVVAQSLVRQRRLDAALRELEAIPEERREVEAHYALGRVHTLRGDAEAARRHLDAAWKADPVRPEILRALVDLDVRDGNPGAAAERIEAALRQAPDDAQLQQLRGEVLLYTGRSSEAEAAFRRAIELDPNDLRSYQSLARYLAVTGRSDEVVATYERALEASPDSGVLHLIVGSLHELQSQPEKAIARYEEAIRLDPSLAVAKNNLAYLLAEHDGNLDRALDLAQDAKGQLPDNPNAADTLGWILYKKNVPGAAIAYLREAVNGMRPEDPQIALVRHHLALAYEANQEPGEALRVLEQAIRDLELIAERQEAGAEPPWAAEIRSMHARLADGSS